MKKLKIQSQVEGLKMCRWICLLSLVLLMLFSASQADSSGQVVPCCSKFTSRKIHVIKECYEQKPRKNCDHAFLIINKKHQWCVRPDADWLKDMIETGKLHCPPDLSF